MAFTWFDKFTDVLKALPPDRVGEMAMAITLYGTEGEEPGFSDPMLAAVFAAVRDDIDCSKKARTKNKGGRPRKGTPVPEVCETGKPPFREVSEDGNPRFEVSETQETPVSVSENLPKPPLCEVSETENPSYKNKAIQSNTKQNKEDNPLNPPSETDGEEFARFAADCIAAFNAETGKDYRSSGGKDWLDLRRIYDNGRTVADVRRVVRSKAAEWGRDQKMAKFVRPSTLFGAKFEEYLAEGEGKPPDASGRCPACGRALVPIGEVVENPKDPTKLWCGHCRRVIGAKEAVA